MLKNTMKQIERDKQQHDGTGSMERQAVRRREEVVYKKCKNRSGQPGLESFVAVIPNFLLLRFVFDSPKGGGTLHCVARQRALGRRRVG
jgi:hypothetical protein